MEVQKVFKILITVVVCVMLGAMIINVLVPNVVANVIDATEGMIYKSTGIAFDFNGNGTTGTSGSGNMDYVDTTDGGNTADQLTTVEGFQ